MQDDVTSRRGNVGKFNPSRSWIFKRIYYRYMYPKTEKPQNLQSHIDDNIQKQTFLMRKIYILAMLPEINLFLIFLHTKKYQQFEALNISQ